MELAQQVADALQAAKDNQVEVSEKLDTLLTKMNQLKEGATKEQMQTLLKLATDVQGGVQGFEDKLDAAQSVTNPVAQPVTEAPAPVSESPVTGETSTGTTSDETTNDTVVENGSSESESDNDNNA